MKTARLLKRTIGATLVFGAFAWNNAAWADPKLTNLVTTLLSPSPISAGTTGTYRVVVYKGTGAFNFFALMSVTNPLPAGVTVTFNPGSIDFSFGSAAIRTGQMLVAVSPSFVSTNFNICVRATVDNNNNDFTGNCGTSVSTASTNAPTCSVTGPATVCPNTPGLIYTNTSNAAISRFLWSVTGNGSIVGPATNATVSVTSGAAGSFTATCEVVDLANHKTNTCDQIVSVADSTPPTITTCATDQFGTADGSCQAAVPSFTNGVVASDSCSAVTISQSPAIGTLVGLGTNTITIRVADSNGNTNTCTASFIVRDLTPPSITSLPADQQGSANGNGQAAVPDFTGGVVASDNCAVSLTITQNPLAGALVGIGANIVTLTVADSTGNSTNATVRFVVTDDTPPTISQCAGDASAEVNSGCQAALPDLTGHVSATDNSGNVTVTQNPPAGTLLGVGPHTITFTATDGSGNTAQCQATFTVTDTTDPVINSCAADVTVDTDPGQNEATHVDLGAPPSASDECGIADVSNNAPASFPLGTNTVTWTITDNNGNTATCQQLVIVEDNEPPTITCPDNILTNLEAGVCSLTELDLGSPATNDNVGIASVSSNAPAIYNLGTNEVIWTATDTAGHEASCTQLVVLVDASAPLIQELPADQQAEASVNCETAVPDFTPGVVASDDCSTHTLTITQEPTAGTLVGPGNTTVTIIVTDDSGNSSTGTVTFTVTDTTAPTIDSCPGDQQADADDTGMAAVPDLSGDLVASDVCGDGGFTVTQSPAAGTLVGIGQHSVTLTVTDQSGNSNQCVATFTVNDATAPTITHCAGDQSASADGNCQASVPDFTGGVAATDNSGTVTVTQNPTAGTLVGPGTHPVTLTVSDAAGNTASCTAEFSVTDTTAPLIACPGNLVLTAPSGSNSVSGVDLGSPVASDNCGTVNVSNDAPSAFPIGDTVVTWSADDGNGNVATCQQTVTVVAGNGAPVARDDDFTVAEDDALEVAAPGVLANDTDDGPLTAVLVSSATHGALTLRPDGSFTYAPEDNFTGTDTFTYKANDGTFDSNVATVRLTVTPVNGAGDVDLYAKTAAFKLNRAAGHRDSFRIKGKINPRGAKPNLAGATLQISVNGTNLFAPVTLDAAGVGSATVGSVKVKARLKSANGLYSFTLNGGNLREAIGLPDANASGKTTLDVTLTIVEADLDITTVRGLLETPYLSAAGQFSRGRFAFKTHRTLTGAFNLTKTTATQLGNGAFKITAKGVIENEGGSFVTPTGPVTAHIGEAVLTVPGPRMNATMNNATRTFKFSVSHVADTGIPTAGDGAPTAHRLPIMLAVPDGDSTNIFETIIELKRPDGTAKKWSR